MAETDPDQAERILTSMLKNVDNSIFRAVTLHLEGELPYGSTESLGIPEAASASPKMSSTMRPPRTTSKPWSKRPRRR